MMPLVSIVVSSFNRPRLIRDALESCLTQTWPNVEIIVADDHSNRETAAVLDEYLKHHITIVRPATIPTDQERRFGSRCAIGINAAMSQVRGEFVCFLPDDDFLPPNSIEARAKFLVENPETHCVYGRLESCKAKTPISGIHYITGESSQFGDLIGNEITFDTTQWRDGAFTAPSAHREYVFARLGVEPLSVVCAHDRKGFWSAEPITRAANKVDHSMMMVRRRLPLPIWPEVRTADLDCDDARFFDALELSHLGPFYSVPEVVVVKRYHAHGHRTDPSTRE